jgi:acetyl-CoA C-acetyltransferase
MRDKPGTFGLVGANGGVMSKYSVGVYSTTPVGWTADRSAELQQDIAALPKVPVTRNAVGAGTIETYSVRYDWPVRTGIIIGRLDTDGSRFMAIAEDEDLVALMTGGDPLRAGISVTPGEDKINRATLA